MDTANAYPTTSTCGTRINASSKPVHPTPPPQPTWTPPPPTPTPIPRVEEQPTATHPTPQPWHPSVQPVQEQPTPSIPPASHPPHITPTPPPIPSVPQFSIGVGQQPLANWANPQPHNRMVGASHHHVQSQDKGGIDKKILIGTGIESY